MTTSMQRKHDFGNSLRQVPWEHLEFADMKQTIFFGTCEVCKLSFRVSANISRMDERICKSPKAVSNLMREQESRAKKILEEGECAGPL